jgi:TPR repeat protein
MTVKWRSISLLMLVFLFACSSSYYNLREGVVDFKKLNYRDAFVRLKPEAFKGQPDAQYAVGFMYYYGFGVYEDRKLAVYWMRKAAAQNQPLAIEALKRLDKEYCGHFCVRQGLP